MQSILRYLTRACESLVGARKFRALYSWIKPKRTCSGSYCGYSTPPPVVAPDNVSRITAIVNKHSIWRAGSLKDAMPPVPDDQTLYAFRLKVLSVEPMDQKTLSAARTGIEIDVFSTVPLAKHWVGKKIAGVIKMVGDTRGVRWIFVDPAALKLVGKG